MRRIGSVGLWALLWVPFTLADFTATVDRTRVSELDLVTLTVRLTNATATGSPDFSRLEDDFDIVGQSGPNRSTRLVIVQGQQSSETQMDWSLTLRPKRLGTLNIPAFELGGEKTDPIQIQVAEASAQSRQRMNQYVFFETSVDTESTYVQGQILYTVKLFYVNAIAGDFPSPPNLPDAVIETVESEKRYESIVNSRRFYVLEKRYAIYPQKSGSLTIPRETFSGTRGRGGIFSAREKVNAVSERHVVQVKPRPPAFTGEHWLPAKNVRLTETWSDGGRPTFKVGEPVNRKLTITADGLASSLLPPFKELNIENAKTYQDPATTEDRATESGIRSSLTTTVGIVPTGEGFVVLPEIRVPWWNTEADRMEVAIIPEQTYKVAAGATQPSGPPQVTAQEPAPQTDVSTPPREPATNIWLYVAIAFGALWLFTLYQWQMARRQLAVVGPEPEEEPVPAFTVDERAAFDQLTRACKQNDASAARRTLFLWGSAHYPHLKSLADLARTAGRDDLHDAIEALDLALYAPAGNADWTGDKLLGIVTEIANEKPERKRESPLVATLNP